MSEKPTLSYPSSNDSTSSTDIGTKGYHYWAHQHQSQSQSTVKLQAIMQFSNEKWIDCIATCYGIQIIRPRNYEIAYAITNIITNTVFSNKWDLPEIFLLLAHILLIETESIGFSVVHCKNVDRWSWEKSTWTGMERRYKQVYQIERERRWERNGRTGGGHGKLEIKAGLLGKNLL